jgi:hypothetical protein
MKMNSAPKMSAKPKNGCSASNAPSAMYHLQRKPAVGGMPTIETAPIAIAMLVCGIVRPTPRRSVSVR